MGLSAPYERIVQWVSGPFSGAVGLAAAEVVDRIGIIPTSKDAAVSKAVVEGVTFGVTTLVTFAAHHKWLDNLATWWGSDAGKIEARVQAGVAKVDPSASGDVSKVIGDVNSVVSEILTGEQAQSVVQSQKGADPATVTHFGAPDATTPGV